MGTSLKPSASMASSSSDGSSSPSRSDGRGSSSTLRRAPPWEGKRSSGTSGFLGPSAVEKMLVGASSSNSWVASRASPLSEGRAMVALITWAEPSPTSMREGTASIPGPAPSVAWGRAGGAPSISCGAG